jgi:hypothetical protein
MMEEMPNMERPQPNVFMPIDVQMLAVWKVFY